MDDTSSSTKRTVSEWQTLFRIKTPASVAAILRGDLALIRMSFKPHEIQRKEVEAITRYTEATVISCYDRHENPAAVAGGGKRILTRSMF